MLGIARLDADPATAVLPNQVFQRDVEVGHAVGGVLHTDHLDRLRVRPEVFTDDPAELLKALAAWEPVLTTKWLSPDER